MIVRAYLFLVDYHFFLKNIFNNFFLEKNYAVLE